LLRRISLITLVYRLIYRTINFGKGNICGKGSIFRGPATSSLQEAGPKRSPILGVLFFYFCVHHLTQNDQSKTGIHIVLYADDILLLAPSVNELQHHLLTMCEAELSSIDMKINVSKSCCLRIGPRSNCQGGRVSRVNDSNTVNR